MRDRLLKLWHDEGGWIQAALLGAGLLGKLFGGGANASADARQQEALLNTQRDRTVADVYGTAQNAQFQNAATDLNRRQFSQQAKPANARQVALGDLLANLKDVNIQAPSGIRMGTVTGGLRPSVLGENSRQAGQELSRQALQSLLEGEHFDPVQMLRPPTPTATPQAGGVEKLFGILGTLGGLAGGIGQIGQIANGENPMTFGGGNPGAYTADPLAFDPRVPGSGRGVPLMNPRS